jgi:hypothetical protein
MNRRRLVEVAPFVSKVPRNQCLWYILVARAVISCGHACSGKQRRGRSNVADVQDNHYYVYYVLGPIIIFLIKGGMWEAEKALPGETLDELLDRARRTLAHA